MEDCLFCKIIRGEIPAEILLDTERVCAFSDINPQTPVHIIIVPKTHVASAAELDEQSQGILGDLVLAANRLAREKGIAESGYRLVMNCGPDAGQTVFHLHLHLMGGRQMGAQG